MILAQSVGVRRKKTDKVEPRVILRGLPTATGWANYGCSY